MTAQVVTITEQSNMGKYSLIQFDWLSTDGGVVASTTTASYNGKIEAVVLVPDTSTTLPSDLYDVTLTDGTIDLLSGLGANCGNATNVAIIDGLIPIAGNKLTLNVANAGNAKGGNVYVYLREM